MFAVWPACNGADGISDIEHVAIGNGAFGESDIEGKAARVAASELGSERVSIARVDGNAARVAGASTGSASDQGKVTRVGASEWSRGDASDIDGQTERSKWAGAHESMRAASEFQSG